jgi:hypothetical protein
MGSAITSRDEWRGFESGRSAQVELVLQQRDALGADALVQPLCAAVGQLGAPAQVRAAALARRDEVPEEPGIVVLAGRASA